MTVHGTAADPLTRLLDAEAASRFLRHAGVDIESATPDYLRHKPGETSLVSYRFVTSSGDAALGYAHWCARPERADEVHRKALTLRPRPSAIGVSVARIDPHTVLYGFPNDARLRRLRWFTTGRKLRRALGSLTPAGEVLSKSRTESTVLKYKPERRVVVRADLTTRSGRTEPVLVRYTTGRTAHRIAATAQALIDAGVPTPAPRAQLEGGRVGVDEFVAGTELRTWLLDGPAVVDELAAALSGLHRTRPPVGTPRRTVADDLDNTLSGLLALASWEPELGRLAATVATALVAARPAAGTAVLIHGDLHDKNVLVGPGGVSLIDLERAAVGEPASDLGRLRAHALSLDVRRPGWSEQARPHAEAVIDLYRCGGPGPSGPSVDDRSLAWHCAVALVDQALLVTRHVEAGWCRSATALLDAARRELEPHVTPIPGATSR